MDGFGSALILVFGIFFAISIIGILGFYLLFKFLQKKKNPFFLRLFYFINIALIATLILLPTILRIF